MRCPLVARPASSAAAWSGRRHTKAARALASSHPRRRSRPSRSHRPCHPRRRSHRRRNRRRRRSVSGPYRRPTAQSLRSAQAPEQTKQRSSQAYRTRRRARWGGEGTGGICWLAVLMTLMSGRACEPSGTWSRGPWKAREGQGVPARPPAQSDPPRTHVQVCSSNVASVQRRRPSVRARACRASLMGSKKVNECPRAPARPVRPMRCT
jgi:hypothetical protein